MLTTGSLTVVYWTALVMFTIAVIVTGVMVYQYVIYGSTPDLFRQLERFKIEQAMEDKLLEELVDLALPAVTVNELADQIVRRICQYHTERALRTKELSR